MEEIGDYKIILQLGNEKLKGSLGASYLAEHRFLKKEVVLKVLPEEFYNEKDFRERFERGVFHLSTLDHPHIVKMHTVSMSNGWYFLVTDFVSYEEKISKNLAQYREEKGSFSHDECYALLHKIALALDYAHSKNIVHGFLKPSNILIGRDGHIAISDFGLAHIIGDALLLRRMFARLCESLSINSLLFLDNFGFLAPEQKRYQLATCASDIFAFGQICHYLLSGHTTDGSFDVDDQLVWKPLLEATLAYREEKRRVNLLTLLKEMSRERIMVNVESSCRPLENNGREIAQAKTPLMASIVPLEVEALVGVSASSENSILTMLKKEPHVTEYYPEKRLQKDMEPIITKMVTIAQGTYFRGTDRGPRDEAPRHQIILPSFSIDIHPVTNEQFIRFLEFMGGEKDEHYHDLIRLKDSRINRSAGRLSIESGYALHPVTGVTWYGAFSYAQWLGKRLPTEAEWEIAAMGDIEGVIYPTGDQIEKKDANFFSSDTTPVMNYAPNSYGLYDMVGNVYEWCQDWYGYNYYEVSALEPTNPKGPMQGVYRVLRGGCWKSLKEDLRISHRHRNNPGTVNGTYGFRCAQDH